MRQSVLVILWLVGYVMLCAQRIATVEATASFEAPLTMSPIEAEYETIRRAQTEAIAREFGTIVTQQSQNFMRENQATSYDDFFAYGETDVRGIWLASIGDTIWSPTHRSGNNIVYSVRMKGKVREIVSTPADVKYTFMYNGTNPKINSMRTNSFYEGDQLFLNFTSPVDGYLALYLVDHNNEMTTQRLLPYPGQPEGAYPIKADSIYTFFSLPDAEPLAKEWVVELMLGCASEHDYNQFYIIFSPHPFTHASDHATVALGQRQLPPSTDYRTFQRWLSRCRRHDVDMFVEKLLVDIIKNK